MILQNQDNEAFEEWFKNLVNEHFYLPHKEMMKLAWNQAIRYDQNKPIRTYRWNGVIF